MVPPVSLLLGFPDQCPFRLGLMEATLGFGLEPDSDSWQVNLGSQASGTLGLQLFRWFGSFDTVGNPG